MRRSVFQSECFICILLVNQTVTEKKQINPASFEQIHKCVGWSWAERFHYKD